MRVVTVGLLLMVGLSLSNAGPSGPPSYQRGAASLPESDLRGAQPIVCHATNSVELSNRHIVADGDAIVVNGSCDVVVSDSHIVAGGKGILVNGNGRVEIERSFIQGAGGAVLAHATSQVKYRNSTLRGGTAKYAMAKIIDNGGNTLEDVPSPSTSRLQSSEPITCSGRDRITVVHRIIETDGDGLVVGGNCEVLLSDSWIVADGYAVRVSDNGSVRIRNSTLEGGEGAVEITGQGRAHAAGSNIRGEVAGRFQDGGGNATK